MSLAKRSKLFITAASFLFGVMATPTATSSAAAFCEPAGFSVTVQYVLYGVDLVVIPGGIVIGECTTDCDGTRTCTGQTPETGGWPFWYFVDERFSVSRCGSICGPVIR